MAVQETNGYLDVENATLRSSKVEVTSNLGIANTAPQHAFSVGSNLYIDTESSNVLTVDGNVVCEGVKVGLIEIIPSYDLAAVSNVGNVTQSTIQFANATTGFVTTANATIGNILTVDGNASISGNLSVTSNLEVGTANLFVDTVNSRVGIGTNNPQEALHVAGSMRLGAAQGVDDDNLKSIVTTSPLEVHSNAEDLDGLGVSLNLRSGFSDSESNIQMLSSRSNSTFQYISFATATTERMRITTAGNVGIGTTNPLQPLHIRGDNCRLVIADSSEDDADTNAFNCGIAFVDNTYDGTKTYAGNPAAGMGFFLGHYSSASKEVNMSNLTGPLSFGTRNIIQAMYINNDGNVGIGTNNPGTKLAVDGNFVCRNFHALGGNPLANFVMRESTGNNTNSLTETIRLNAPGRPTVVKVNYQGGSVAGLIQRLYCSEITFNWDGNTTLSVSTLYAHNNGGTWSVNLSVVSNGTVTLQVVAPGAGSYNSLLTQWYNNGGIYLE